MGVIIQAEEECLKMPKQGQVSVHLCDCVPKEDSCGVCFSEGAPFSWWVGGSAPGQAQHFWGGARPGSHQCACGLQQNCLDSNHFCNCDADSDQWYRILFFFFLNVSPQSLFSFHFNFHFNSNSSLTSAGIISLLVTKD